MLVCTRNIKKYLEVVKFTWCTIYIEILWNHAPQRWHTAPGGWAQQLGGPLASLLPVQKCGFYILQHSHILHMLECTRNIKKYLEVVKFTWCTIYIEILWNHAPQRWHTAPGGWAQQLGGPLASPLPARDGAFTFWKHKPYTAYVGRCKKYLEVGKRTWCTVYIQILWNRPCTPKMAHRTWRLGSTAGRASGFSASCTKMKLLYSENKSHLPHMLVCI